MTKIDRHLMRNVIFFYLLSKIIIVSAAYVYWPILFGQSIFKFNDFGYYVSGDLGVGPNIGYRWILWLLGIGAIDELLPVFLASIINISVDLAWLHLLRKYLGFFGILFFALALGFHPYAATYTVKFSSIIFAKIGVYFFCKNLINGGLDGVVRKKFLFAEWLILVGLTMLRNSNLFIFSPYIFLRLRCKPMAAFMAAGSFIIIVYLLSGEYMSGVNPSKWPWTVSYVKEVFEIEHTIIALPLTVIARSILLFGGREKLFTSGLEPFLVPGIPSLQLFVFVLLGVLQFYGFYVAIRFFLTRYGAPSLVLMVPVILSMFSVAHQRYLIPFIPICLFGLGLVVDKLLAEKGQ